MRTRIADAALVLIAMSAALAAVLILDSDPLLGSWAFAAILFALLALSMRTAVSAVIAAHRQRRRATEVHDISPYEAAQDALVVERRRMSADIVATVRQSLERMAVLAGSLPRAGDARATLRGIQAEGRAVAVELRRELGLLRYQEPDPSPASDTVPYRTHRLRRRDLFLGAGMVALALVLGLFAEGMPSAAQIGFSAAAAGTIALWRLNPGLAATINALIAAVGLALGHPVLSDLWLIFNGGLLIWACIARPVHDKFAVVGPAAMSATVMISEWATNPVNVHIMAIVFGVGIVTALGFRFADASRGRSEWVAVSREQELAQAAASAVRADRLRFARELHDTVSGTVGTITMRAAAAEMLWESNPQGAHESIGIVRRAIGSALAELDHLIPSLDAALGDAERPEGESERLDDVRGVVQRMRDAGVAVEADLDPTSDVPPAVARAAYRVVQEALANCARHAPGAKVRVQVRRVTDDLVVEVVDDGPGLRGARPGYGQVGMRERVAALGGTVSLQSGNGGVGLLVRATLPMQGAGAVTR